MNFKANRIQSALQRFIGRVSVFTPDTLIVPGCQNPAGFYASRICFPAECTGA